MTGRIGGPPNKEKGERKMQGWFEKGSLWGKAGYSIAIGLEDFLFYFGDLEEAKRAACERHGINPRLVTWHKMN